MSDAAMRIIAPLLLVNLLAIAGCALARREAPPVLFGAAVPVGFPSAVRYFSADRHGAELRAAEQLQRLRTASKEGTVNILAAVGRWRGRCIRGWRIGGLGRRGERPEFRVVTGVGTGALIAPFAFWSITLSPESYCRPWRASTRAADCSKWRRLIWTSKKRGGVQSL